MYQRRLAMGGLLMTMALLVAVPAPASEGLDLLPASTDGLITFTNIERLHQTLGIGELRREHPSRFEELSRGMIDEVGIDLLDLAALREAGIRTDAPVHLAWLGEPMPTVVLIVPGSESTLIGLMRGEDSGTGFTQEVAHGGLRIVATPDGRCASYALRSHVVIVGMLDGNGDGDEDRGDALDRARFLLDQDEPPLSKSSRFRKAMRNVRGDADVVAYSGPRLYRQVVRGGSPEQFAKHDMTPEEAMEMYESLGLANTVAVFKVGVYPDRISGEGYASFDRGSEVLGWYDVDANPVPFLERLAASPWLVSISRLDGAALWSSFRAIIERMLPDSTQSLDEELADLREETGIDLESEVARQINGNVGFVVDRAGLMGGDGVVFVQVIDEDRLRGTLARVTEEARESMKDKSAPGEGSSGRGITEERVGDVLFYKIAFSPTTEICYGVVDAHLVVTLSETRFRSIVAGDLGLFDAVNNDVVVSALRSRNGAAFYIDFAGVLRDVMDVAFMMGPKSDPLIDVLRGLRDLSATTTLEETGMRHQYELRCWKPGMWKHLAALMLQIEEEGP